ncbi:immunoglobulin lambda-1 light chain-like [Hyla sarda]|uniref:immunoglobulin lambda-1 light chain-like n=1 Tax=Hyla sarda TaxID=327740 RepID=UPI0024C227C8|nr:immunoglobulin lambda-1 light chain-like [Hyla sarda]
MSSLMSSFIKSLRKSQKELKTSNRRENAAADNQPLPPSKLRGKETHVPKDAALTTSINVTEIRQGGQISTLQIYKPNQKNEIIQPAMRSAAVTYLLMCLIFPGSAQVEVHQYKQVSVSEGSTAELACHVDGGNIQDFSVQWYKQVVNAAPQFILIHTNDSGIRWSDASPGRYQPSRNSSRTHLLHVTNVTAQDSALYWCLLARNDSSPIWADGTLLSVYGGKDVQAPTVSLLSSEYSVDDSGPLYVACLANGFYPSVIEITWKLEDESFKGNLISGPFLEEGSNVYSIISILEVTSQGITNLTSVYCEVRHDSSRTLIHKDLHDCFRDT